MQKNLSDSGSVGHFCEIPPGNSRAEEHKAPLPDSVKTWLDSTPQDALPYQQGDSQTCVFTSFANAMHYLGLHKEAAQMNTNKEDFLKVQMGGNSTPLRGLPVYLHALGLSWLQPKRIANFTLEDIGKLTQNQLLVGSL